MRDPERIDKILNTIRLIWTDCPDLRLCQLIANAVGHHKDIFHIEDEEFVQRLVEFGLEIVKDETEDKLLVQSGCLEKLMKEAKDERNKGWKDFLADRKKED